MRKCQWPEMPIKLLKNGKQQQTAPPPLFPLFFFSPVTANSSRDLLTSWWLSLSPFTTQLVGNLQEVWWKWEQKCARCFWLLCGYQWMMLPRSNFWHLSQLGPSAPCSALANSTLISLALWAGWLWRMGTVSGWASWSCSCCTLQGFSAIESIN